MQSAREEIRELERVRYVTENYQDLQGLRRVPAGLMVLIVYAFVVATSFEITTKFVADIVVTIAVLVIVMLVLGFFGIRKYYEKRYGAVRMIPKIFRRRRAYGGLAAIAVMLVVGYLALFMYEIQNFEPYPFLFIGLGTMEVADRWPELRFRPHYFVLGSLMVLFGLILLILMLQGSQYSEMLFLHLLTGFFVLQLVAGGILDHLLLVRTMKRLPEEGPNAIR